MKKSLVLCPLPLELDVFLKNLKIKKIDYEIAEAGSLRVFLVPKLNLRLALGGHGKAQFAIQTQFLLDYYPDTQQVFFAGTAGSLDNSIPIFDVVVGVKTVEHDFKLSYVKRSQPEFIGSEEILTKISAIDKKLEFKIHKGIIASGDEDIMDGERAYQIFTLTKAVAVAWEGAGGARAAKFNKIPFLEVRGITDIASSEIKADFASNLKISMNNVFETIFEIL